MHWDEGQRRPYSSEELQDRGVECARCGPWFLHNGSEVRFFPDGPGYLCEGCFKSAPSCKVEGCEGVAVERGLCRDCYIKSDEILKEVRGGERK